MLKRLVGKSRNAAVHDEIRAGPNNKTAESELLVEFTKLNGLSPHASPSNSLQKEDQELGLQTLRTHRDAEVFKYTTQWQHARAKLKSRLMLVKLRKELNLFGTEPTTHSGRSTTISLFDSDLRITSTRKWILTPRSCFLDAWQLVLAISIMYTTIVFPFRMAFYEKPSYLFVVLDFFVDTFFIFDVVVNLNSAYFDSDFELVTNRTLIFCRYAKSWFIFDVLSCIPITTSDLWLVDEAQQGNFSEMLRFLRLPRLYRLVKILRILDATSPSGQNRLLEKCKVVLKLNHGSVKLLNTVLMIFIAIHMVSCIWYLSARLTDSPDTWVSRLGQADEDVGVLYVASMYWAVTTLATVGYGDINGYTNVERIICICWMFCGIYFLSFTIGSLSAFLSNINTKENVLVSKLATIEGFAKDAHLSNSLKMELRAAIQYCTERSSLSWSDKQNMLNELPKKLRFELALAMHQGAAKSLSFFEGKDPVFISAVVPFMQPLFVKVGIRLYEQGEYADEVYFIVSGRVSYIVEDGFVYRTLHQGSYFGDIEVIQMIPRKYTVCAAVDSNLLTMKKALLDLIQSDFPMYWNEMKSVSEKRDLINDTSRKQFVNLMALKKAGQLDKADPRLIKEKLRRLSTNRSAAEQSSAEPITVASLQSQVAQAQNALSTLHCDIGELRQTVEDIVEMLRAKQDKNHYPLSLGQKAKVHSHKQSEAL